MSERVLTLFGEELPLEPAPKGRAKKKTEDKKEQPATNGSDDATALFVATATDAAMDIAADTVQEPELYTEAVTALDDERVTETNTNGDTAEHGAPLPDSETPATTELSSHIIIDALPQPQPELVLQLGASQELINADELPEDTDELQQEVVSAAESMATAVEDIAPTNAPEEPLHLASVTEDQAATEAYPEVALPDAEKVADMELQEVVTADNSNEVITAAPEQPTRPKAKQKATPEPTANNLPDDWKGEKQYYTIGEVAALFKVNTSNIRFWTNEFGIKVRTNRKGDRMYTEAQIREIKTIYHLVKERGFTLSGARARMKHKENKEVLTIDLKEQLSGLRSTLVVLRSRL